MRCARIALLGSALLVAGSCYAERLPPPTYRYACSQDGDCDAPERCIRNLCQVPCTMQTVATDCAETSAVTCLNGTCASVCRLDDEDPCPETQVCINLGIVVESRQGPQRVGLCGASCLEVPCPSGEACVEVGDVGLCALLCDPEAPECPSGFSCPYGVCMPDALLDETPDAITAGAPVVPVTATGLPSTDTSVPTTTSDGLTTDMPLTSGDLTSTTDPGLDSGLDPGTTGDPLTTSDVGGTGS